MTVKKVKMEGAERDFDEEHLNIIRTIIDDFESNEKFKSNNGKKKKCRGRKISHSDSLIHKCKRSQVSPRTTSRIIHRSLEGYTIESRSLQNVVKSEDNLYFKFYEKSNSIENADANSIKNLRSSSSSNGKNNNKKGATKNDVRYASLNLDDAQVYMETKKHQEFVRNNVRESKTPAMAAPPSGRRPRKSTGARRR